METSNEFQLIDNCPNCGEEKTIWLTLCALCIDAKEDAYQRCSKDGVVNWVEVMQQRARALAARRVASV